MAQALVWGASAQARLLATLLARAGVALHRLFDPCLQNPVFESGADFSNDVRDLERFVTDCTHFVVAIGGEHGFARCQVHDYLSGRGLKPVNLRHPRAFVEFSVQLGAHHHVLLGSVVNHFVQIGDCSILNTNSCIDHECNIGRGVHVMGSAAIAGRVTIGDYVTIGTNATIIPGVTIGRGAYVGAGAVVVGDVAENTVVTGIPARKLRDHVLQREKTIESLIRP